MRSIVASFGALVCIFQDGNLSKLLNFTPLGFVDATLPILIFCTIFGVSMDYEVFLLSRIREAYENGDSNTASVAKGLVSTAGIITSAAAIIIVEPVTEFSNYLHQHKGRPLQVDHFAIPLLDLFHELV